MSQYWDDEDDAQQEPTPRGLRKQIEELTRKLNERDNAIAELQKVNRQRTIADGLSSLGVAHVDKIAKLVPSDVADSPDKLKGWVEEFKDIFAIQTTSASGATDQGQNDSDSGAGANANPNLDADQIAAFNRMQTADASAGVTTPDMEQSQLAQLAAARDASGGDFDRYIAILRGEIQP